MEFAVVGLGLFGKRISLCLEELGHRVLAIDEDKERINEVQDRVTRAVIADATSTSVLEEFFYPDLDGVIITVGDLEASVLTTLHTQKLDVEPLVVKSTSPEHTVILQRLDIDWIIRPEEDAAERLAEKLAHPNIDDFVELRYGLAVVEITVPASFHGKTLRDLNLRERYDIQVVAVRSQDEESMRSVGAPTFEFNPGDQIAAIGSMEKIETFARKMDGSSS